MTSMGHPSKSNKTAQEKISIKVMGRDRIIKKQLRETESQQERDVIEVHSKM